MYKVTLRWPLQFLVSTSSIPVRVSRVRTSLRLGIPGHHAMGATDAADPPLQATWALGDHHPQLCLVAKPSVLFLQKEESVDRAST